MLQASECVEMVSGEECGTLNFQKKALIFLSSYIDLASSAV